MVSNKLSMKKLLAILFLFAGLSAGAQDTANYKIIIDTSISINHSGVFNKQVTETTGFDSSWVLFDQQRILDTSFASINGGDNLIYWKSVHDTVTIDLGGYYSLFRIDMVVNSSNGSMYYQYGTPGHWSSSVVKNMSSSNRWAQMNQSGKVYTRYLRIGWNSFGSTSRVSELLLYGHLISDSLPRESSTAQDTANYKISISNSAKFWHGDTIFYQVNDIKGTGFVDSLFDEQEADPENGITIPTPTTPFISDNPTHAGYPAIAVVDLGGYYCITDKWAFLSNGTDSINITYGTPFHWSTPITVYANGGGWKDLNTKKIYTRYLKIYWSNVGYQKLYEMIFYGHLVSDSLTRTAPTGVYTASPHLKMSDFMGANIWGGIPTQVFDGIGNNMREYVPQDYIDTSLYQHNVDSIIFTFDKFSTLGTRQYSVTFPDVGDTATEIQYNTLEWDLRKAKSKGWNWFFAVDNIPAYLSGYHYAYAIDSVNHPDRDSTDAKQYDRSARMFWQLGAFYGRNHYPADSMQIAFPPNDSSGLNLAKYFEIGNEMNGTWYNPNQYYMPSMEAAYLSANYDGDDNTMGPRMGIKNADDSIIVVQPGTAGVHPERLKSIYFYSQYKRPDGKLPVDVINIHNYPAYQYHLSPEETNPITYYASFDSISHEVCPTCPVWLTEWGYARNSKSINAVAKVPGQDSAQVQANWVARYWLLLSFSGIQRATYYSIRNEPTQMGRDSASTGLYQSMGLTDWYWAFPVYYFVHTIDKTLGQYKPDSIVYMNHDSLYVLRYRNVNHTDSVAYAIWSGTETNRSVDSFSIQTGHNSTGVRVIQLADKKMYGDTTNTTTETDGTLPMVITETPQFLFTTEGSDGGQLVAQEAAPPVTIKKLLMYNGKLIRHNGKIILLNSTQ